jgi:hypothetical protein
VVEDGRKGVSFMDSGSTPAGRTSLAEGECGYGGRVLREEDVWELMSLHGASLRWGEWFDQQVADTLFAVESLE